MEGRRREGAQRVWTGGVGPISVFLAFYLGNARAFAFAEAWGGLGHVILSSISSKIRLGWLVVFSLFAIVAFRDWMVAVTRDRQHWRGLWLLGSLKRPAGSPLVGGGLIESVPSRLSCDASCYMVREYDEGFGERHE